MNWEYQALFWTTLHSYEDTGFLARRGQMCEDGWEEYIQAPCKGGGGACIMRRPKDEPRMWTEAKIREIAGSVYIGFDTEKFGHAAGAWGDTSGLAKEETNG